MVENALGPYPRGAETLGEQRTSPHLDGKHAMFRIVCQWDRFSACGFPYLGKGAFARPRSYSHGMPMATSGRARLSNIWLCRRSVFQETLRVRTDFDVLT